jgi:hypothetical protein
MFPDIRHVEEILIDSPFTKGVRNSGLMVLGQAATQLSPFSRIVSAICLALSVEHAKMLSCACTTLPKVDAYSTTEGTLTTLPMLAPQ